MRLLFYSLFGLLLAVIAAIFLPNETGRITLVYSGYTIQTGLGVFVFLLIVVFILLYLLIRLLSRLLSVPGSYRSRRDMRRQGCAENHLARGLLALDEGDWHAAEKAFKQGARFSRWPVLHYIGAARAAQQLGAPDRRDAWLDQVAASGQDNSQFAASIVRAELQIEQQQTEQAYALLQQLHADHPSSRRVRSLLLPLSQILKDWPQMLQLLNEYERSGDLPGIDIHAGQIEAWSGMLEDADDMDGLQQVWHDVPSKLKKEPDLIRAYAESCLQKGDTADGEPLIRDMLRGELDPALVRLYGLVQGKDTGKQIAVVEKLLSTHATDSVLQLTAGRLYKRAALWGRARHCLEESLKLNPSVEACHELATMFESQGDAENANKYFRQGLMLAVEGK